MIYYEFIRTVEVTGCTLLAKNAWDKILNKLKFFNKQCTSEQTTVLPTWTCVGGVQKGHRGVRGPHRETQ